MATVEQPAHLGLECHEAHPGVPHTIINDDEWPIQAHAAAGPLQGERRTPAPTLVDRAAELVELALAELVMVEDPARRASMMLEAASILTDANAGRLAR